MYLNPKIIKIGEGATVCRYTDREVFTIVAKTAKTITLQRDKATRLNDPVIIPGGFAGHCINNHDIKYNYERDEKGEIIKANWSEKKKRYQVGGYYAVIDGRHEFYDYNF